MKSLFLAFLLPLSAFAQQIEVPVVFPDYEFNILYRNYQNKVYFGSINGVTDYEVKVEGGTLTKQSDYYILTATDRSLSLVFLDKTSGDTLLVKNYRCKVLPDLQVYLGSATDGEKGDKSARAFSISYPPDVYLKMPDFKVVSWEMEYNGMVIKGTGSELTTEALLKIKEVKSGENVVYIVTFNGPDGVIRKRATNILY